MSLSDDDDFDNGEESFLKDTEEQIDYYAILNVAPNASIDEINKAYKQRSRIFHPDRHTNEADKKEAERIFCHLRNAYETLTDPQKRAIYDAVGIQGLDLNGWQLIAKTDNIDDIRRKYEFLKKHQEDEIMLQRVHPTSHFIVRANCAGLFAEDPDDRHDPSFGITTRRFRYPPQLQSIVITQSVDSMITSSDRLGLVGRVSTANGRGTGSFDTIWRKNAYMTQFESLLSCSPEAISLSTKAARSLTPKSMIALQPSLQYLPLHDVFNPSFTALFTMILRPRWHGTLLLNFSLKNLNMRKNSSLTAEVVRIEPNISKFSTRLTLASNGGINARVYYNQRFANENLIETSLSTRLLDLTATIGIERRLSRFSRVGFSVAFSYPSFLLHTKFRLRTGLHSYDLQIVLCDNKDDIARATLYGFVLPYMVIRVLKWFLQKQISKFMRLFDDRLEDQSVDEAKKEESQRVIHLMRGASERISIEEEKRHGLIIKSAKYGQMLSNYLGSEHYPLPGENLIDVTIPLQAMVNDSQLRIFTVKSHLPGFYDPCPGEPKLLRVEYLFRGENHLVTVPDEVPLNIPMRGMIIIIPYNYFSTSNHDKRMTV